MDCFVAPLVAMTTEEKALPQPFFLISASKLHGPPPAQAR